MRGGMVRRDKTSPSPREGDACKQSAARRGCTKFTAFLNPL